MKKSHIEVDILTSGRIMGYLAEALEAMREKQPSLETSVSMGFIITMMIEEQQTLSDLVTAYKNATD